MTVAGVVLAGGQGRRFGGPKALASIDGVRLVDRAVAALRTAGCDPVIVMAGSLDLTVEGAVVLADPGAGPLRALAVAAHHLGSGELVALACDTTDAPLADLLARPGPAVAVDGDGRPQPLCARWPVAGVIETAATTERAMALVDSLTPRAVIAPRLRNRNAPEE